MRDTDLLSIRPQLATEPTTTSAETFQNQTLRPVLKLQNDLLISLFRHDLLKRKQLGPDNRFARMSQAEQEAYIDHTVRTDQKFRNKLIGTIIGQFTTDELTHFFADEAELTRRLGNLITQRLQNQRERLF